MRLSSNERKVILEVVRRADPKAKVFLYGSRTKDHLKGGDIDLLVISDTLQFKNKIDILTELNLGLGEQKIDLVIKPADDFHSDPFISHILKEAVELTAD